MSGGRGGVLVWGHCQGAGRVASSGRGLALREMAQGAGSREASNGWDRHHRVQVAGGIKWKGDRQQEKK